MNTTANKITLVRIILIPVYMVLAYLKLNVWAFAVYVIACVSDMADGYIARHYNQITNIGKFMDPLADKMLVLSVMVIFTEQGIMPGWAVAIVIFREFAVSGMRLIAAQKGSVIAAAKSGKVKTAVTMVGLGAMIICPRSILLDYVVIALILLTTVYSGVEYFVVNRDVFKD